MSYEKQMRIANEVVERNAFYPSELFFWQMTKQQESKVTGEREMKATKSCSYSAFFTLRVQINEFFFYLDHLWFCSSANEQERRRTPEPTS